MREIKFRAWDKAMKQWVSVGFHAFGETTLFNLIGTHCFENNLGKTSLERQLDDIEVTQFTGLKDKNGKDIYEGDIVRNWQGGWNVVIFKAPSFEATISSEESSMYSHEWWDKVEITGNIYETPQLLKEKTNE